MAYKVLGWGMYEPAPVHHCSNECACVCMRERDRGGEGKREPASHNKVLGDGLGPEVLYSSKRIITAPDIYLAKHVLIQPPTHLLSSQQTQEKVSKV